MTRKYGGLDFALTVSLVGLFFSSKVPQCSRVNKDVSITSLLLPMVLA